MIYRKAPATTFCARHITVTLISCFLQVVGRSDVLRPSQEETEYEVSVAGLEQEFVTETGEIVPPGMPPSATSTEHLFHYVDAEPGLKYLVWVKAVCTISGGDVQTPPAKQHLPKPPGKPSMVRKGKVGRSAVWLQWRRVQNYSDVTVIGYRINAIDPGTKLPVAGIKIRRWSDSGEVPDNEIRDDAAREAVERFELCTVAGVASKALATWQASLPDQKEEEGGRWKLMLHRRRQQALGAFKKFLLERACCIEGPAVF